MNEAAWTIRTQLAPNIASEELANLWPLCWPLHIDEVQLHSDFVIMQRQINLDEASVSVKDG